MRFYQTPRFWVVLGVTAVGLIIAQQFWLWEVERIEVPPGKFLVLVHRWGRDLPEGDIVAPDDSYKGVMLEVRAEGRHFLNPLFWGHQVHDMIDVPKDQCLVLTQLYGAEIPYERIARGDILAGPNERGIVKDVKGPGSYRLNPYAYSWTQHKAVEVRGDQVGVRCLKVGKDPRTLPADPQRGAYVVPDGYRGVQQGLVPSGTYYVNPFVETITPVEVRSHRVELTDIRFPSRDGFILKPHVLVEYAVQPSKAPELLVRLTDEGVLHQEDTTSEEQARNEILQKVILPHIRGYARIEGSNFDARDFIITPTAAAAAPVAVVNSREVLQRALLAKVKPKCKELGIDIRAVTLAELVPPPELAKQISDRELARVEQEKNKVQVRQLKAMQELTAATGLKQQAHEKVEAETRLVQAKTKAEQLKEVELSKLKTDLENTQLRLDAAKQQADAVLAKANAEASVIGLQNEAQVAGIRRAIQGFRNVQDFAQYQVIKRVAPALAEIFASDDSEFAKLFSGLMTAPSTAKPVATPVLGAPAPSGTANGRPRPR
jgi:regulator of protease activity HflC (stomatin/prohibitin superfamily)